MPIPVPDEFYTAQMEELLSELSPEQRRLFADWIEQLTFYCRELMARTGAGISMSAFLNENGETTECAQSLDTSRQNLDYLWHVFETLRSKAGYKEFPPPDINHNDTE